MKKILLIFVLIIVALIIVRYLSEINVFKSETPTQEKNTSTEENKREIKNGDFDSSDPIKVKEDVTPTINPEGFGAEECMSQSGKEMKIETAILIGVKQCQGGKLDLQEEYYCNDYTGTWWIGFTPDEPKAGCNPACVVDIENETAEINWRCTGLIKEN